MLRSYGPYVGPVNNIELKEKIIRLLKENDGRMKQEEVCTLLGIDICEIPWGYNIGWGVCLQVGGTHYLILSGQRMNGPVA